MRGVFDHPKAASSGECQNRVQLARPAAKINEGDRLALGRPFFFGLIAFNRKGVRIDVNEDDIGAEMTISRGCRRESQPRRQNRVSGPYAAGFGFEMDPRSGRIDRNGFNSTVEDACETLFKFVAAAPSCGPPRLRN